MRGTRGATGIDVRSYLDRPTASAAMAVDALGNNHGARKKWVTLRPKMAMTTIVFGRRAPFLDPRLLMSWIRACKIFTRATQAPYTGWNRVAKTTGSCCHCYA